MPRYKVTMIEKLVETFVLEVEADNEDAAEEKAEQMLVDQIHVAVNSETTDRWADEVEEVAA